MPRTASPHAKRDLVDELHELIMNLIVESQSPLYTDQEQQRLSNAARALRAKRMHLRAMEFEAATSGYQDATKQLSAVNTTIQESIDRINDLVAFLGNVAKLAAALDEIIKAAAKVA